MKKINYLKFFILLSSFLFVTKNSFAQVNLNEKPSTKTVVYKIHVPGAKQTIDQPTCDTIDKMFMGKTGIITSKTDAITLETKVTMALNIPEKDLKTIFISQKLEVEKINVVENKN